MAEPKPCLASNFECPYKTPCGEERCRKAPIAVRDYVVQLERRIANEAVQEAHRLLGEWLKKSAAHRPEINEFKGGYQPFLERATREYLASQSYVEESR